MDYKLSLYCRGNVENRDFYCFINEKERYSSLNHLKDYDGLNAQQVNSIQLKVQASKDDYKTLLKFIKSIIGYNKDK